jgi:putative FmdB family regulatory protein
MPTYDMMCDACEYEWEVTHGVNEPHPKECPKCGAGGKKVHQTFNHPPAIHNHYSLMHPRHMRGMRIDRSKKKK